ncbi:MAG: hemerythrin family protein [Gallionella sp.]|nr:hemerythrin family protein [Gallionella sp.]
MEYPQVALDFMNRDHADFVTMHTALLAALDANAASAELALQLETLIAHTRHHFAEEERQMQSTGFPPYAMHKGEHERVLAQMEQQLQDWRNDPQPAVLRQWLAVTVKEWFINHVSTMDLITARFIAACKD